jgi:thiol-disulfide isomerase/thioredoxin
MPTKTRAARPYAIPELTPKDFTHYSSGPLKGKSSLVLFYADWCGHCENYRTSQTPKQLAELIKQHPAAKKLGFYEFEGSTLPDHQKISSEFFAGKPINSWPTFVLIHVGADAKASLKFDFVSRQVDRDDPQAQFQALLDFANKMGQTK